MSSRTLFVTLLALCAATGAHADIVVGGYGDSIGAEPMRAFADTANGAATPLRVLGGPLSTLVSPAGGFHEANEGVLYVADFWGQAIRVYPAYADGDVAPLRVLDTPHLGQVRTLAVDTVHDELLTIGSGCCLRAFQRMASGNKAFPIRSLQWGGSSGSVTGLNSPYALVLMAQTDEIALIDTDATAPYAPKMLVFNRSDSGNTAPKRVLKGAQTQFGAWIGGIAHDAVAQRLYLAAYSDNPDFTRSARILVFPDQADGDSAPLHSIAGPATGLALAHSASPTGIAIDPVRRRLIVAIGDHQTAGGNRLLVFDLDASGNAAPLQEITDTQSGPASSLGAPVWLPHDPILRNGFD